MEIRSSFGDSEQESKHFVLQFPFRIFLQGSNSGHKVAKVAHFLRKNFRKVYFLFSNHLKDILSKKHRIANHDGKTCFLSF